MAERIEVNLGPIKKIIVQFTGSWLGETEEGRRYISSGTYDPKGSGAAFTRRVFSEFLETGSALLIEDPDSGYCKVVPTESVRFWVPVGWKP